MEQQHIPTHTQPNVVIIGKNKSVGVAFLLTFLFGPLGLFYSSVIGGIVMLVLGLLLFFLLPLVGIILTWIGSIIWAVIAANTSNAAMHKQAKGIVQNPSAVHK